mgnify:CR=1 FL=1
MTYEDFKDKDEAELNIKSYLADIMEELKNNIFINYYGQYEIGEKFPIYLRKSLIEIYFNGKNSNNK